ncbi:MAG: hypothetical protein ACRDD7_03750 [Peptostreptococcaceae bacterium]
MDRYKTKYIIGEVLDNDTQKRSKEWGYRVGRECYVVLAQVGYCLIVEYPDGNIFRTSTVKKVEETDYGLWIETNNRTYRFDTESFYK